MKLYCDLHLHSCLSPCGDDDMTPNNIVHMAKLKGLTCIALTDHNTAMNCRATAMAARQAGLGFIPGMELSTAEDIHLICLFPDCDKAEAFSRPRSHPGAYCRGRYKSRGSACGHQIRLDELDRPVGEEETLLLNATMIPLTEAPALVREYGGVCYPAHIDKIANSVLAILGSIPPECEEEFDTVEVSPRYESRPGTPPHRGILRRPLSLGHRRSRA